jgi:hypothetical protein
VKLPPELGAPTPWVKVDLAASGLHGGADGAQLRQFQQADPTQFLAYLRGVSDEVETLGREAVRGVGTTHYRATVDLERASREAGAFTDPERFRQLVEQLGTSTVDLDVWVDDEGRVRRQRFEQPLPEPPGATVGVTLELFDYGAPVEVSAPPADQVTDLTELLSG